MIIRITLIKMVDPIYNKGLHTNITNFQNMWYDDDDECFCCRILWSYSKLHIVQFYMTRL